MKFFFCIVLALISYAAANLAVSGANSGSSSSSNSGNVQEADGDIQHKIVPATVADLTRLRKSAYGGASSGGYSGASSAGYGGSSMPALPCPKNYLFSCQPNLSPVACSAPSSSYGSTGAYSAPVPTYVTPFRGNYGVPQAYSAAAYVPQGFGYNHNNHYYQY